MPSESEIEMARWRGGVDEQLKTLNKSVTDIDKKLDTVVGRVSMAQGGWIALMAVIGMVASVGGLIFGAFKAFAKGA